MFEKVWSLKLVDRSDKQKRFTAEGTEKSFLPRKTQKAKIIKIITVIKQFMDVEFNTRQINPDAWLISLPFGQRLA